MGFSRCRSWRFDPSSKYVCATLPTDQAPPYSSGTARIINNSHNHHARSWIPQKTAHHHGAVRCAYFVSDGLKTNAHKMSHQAPSPLSISKAPPTTETLSHRSLVCDRHKTFICNWLTTFADSQASSGNAAPSSTPAKSTPGRSRGPIRRVPIHTTKLEALDDSLGPLGPLGDNVSTPLSSPEQPPAPPQKESTLTLNQRQPDAASRARDIMNPEYDNDPEPSGRPRVPPPVQPSQAGSQRNIQPSVSIEQAAKPTFDITVGDPHKVGDLTSSHIVYQVRTRVSESILARLCETR